MNARAGGNQHRSQQRAAAGENQAVDGDDDRRPLQVLEFGMRDLAVDLGQALLAAHGQNRVAEGHQDAEKPENRQSSSAQEAERILTEVEMRRDGRRRQLRAAQPHRISAPDKQNHHHHRGNLHHPQCLVARLLDSLDVLPPVVDRHQRAQQRRGVVHVELDGLAARVHQRRRQPVRLVGHIHQLVDQTGDVLAGRHARDRPGKNVIEHQRRHAELGESASQGLLHHAVNAAAREHRAALDVHRAHREAEQHDAEDEPGRSRSHRLLGDAAGVEGRGTQVIENDSRRAPEGDEGEHHRGGDDQPHAVIWGSYGRSGRGHREGSGEAQPVVEIV